MSTQNTSTSPLAYYRDHWYEIGGVLGLGVLGTLALKGADYSTSHTYAVLNFATLTAHQFEEYKFPGTFPVEFNSIWGSEHPDRYPGNAQSAMVINTVFAYPFNLLPVLFPEQRWLGIGAALFGFSQTVGHGISIPRQLKRRYSAGQATAVLLYLPVGVGYLRAMNREKQITRKEWGAGLLYALGFAAVGVVAPQLALADKNSPYHMKGPQIEKFLRDHGNTVEGDEQ